MKVTAMAAKTSLNASAIARAPAARVSHLGHMRLITRRGNPAINEDMSPQSKAVSCGPGARGGGHGPCWI